MTTRPRRASAPDPTSAPSGSRKTTGCGSPTAPDPGSAAPITPPTNSWAAEAVRVSNRVDAPFGRCSSSPMPPRTRAADGPSPSARGSRRPTSAHCSARCAALSSSQAAEARSADTTSPAPPTRSSRVIVCCSGSPGGRCRPVARRRTAGRAAPPMSTRRRREPGRRPPPPHGYAGCSAVVTVVGAEPVVGDAFCGGAGVNGSVGATRRSEGYSVSGSRKVSDHRPAWPSAAKR